MVEFTDDISVWEEADRLACPLLRWNDKFGKWVALGEDPCPTKKCKWETCHNYGRPFHDPKRLIIVKVKNNAEA
ncbi:MAG: hypothetical protein B6U76_00985 [Desulfurococcales archaeon ex4484_217_2]|nr:MAG: hypothetical protein B6U76_00985 [Desulfurococcales archaeon ex4484_217_2]